VQLGLELQQSTSSRAAALQNVEFTYICCSLQSQLQLALPTGVVLPVAADVGEVREHAAGCWSVAFVGIIAAVTAGAGTHKAASCVAWRAEPRVVGVARCPQGAGPSLKAILQEVIVSTCGSGEGHATHLQEIQTCDVI
jgi:hypothetical protein